MNPKKRIEELETAVTSMCPEALPLPAATRRLYSAVFGNPPSAGHLARVLVAQGLPEEEAVSKAATIFADLAEDTLPDRAMYDPDIREAMLRASEREFGSDGSKPAGNATKLPGPEELT